MKDNRNMAETTTSAPGVKIAMPPFTIEIDHPRNCDVIVQSIPGCRLRSKFIGSRPIVNQKTGDASVPVDQGKAFANFPTVPGMQLRIDPKKCKVQIIDPLHGDKELCRRIVRYFNSNGQSTSREMDGVPPREESLDIHRMKTLVREVAHLVNIKQAVVVKGNIPEQDDIDDLDGYYLTNPGSTIRNDQPKYEKDMDDWMRNLK